MQYKTLTLCASAMALAVALACSKNAETPTAPSSAQPGAADAAADGSTLKVSAPTPQSPVNNQQIDSLVLTATRSTPAFGSTTPLSYEFEIKNAAGATVCPSGLISGGSAATVSYSPTNCTLEFDQSHTWRVRAGVNNGRGPWSVSSTFRSNSGGYMRDNEVFDPLTNGRTVGEVFGPVTFIPGVGARLETATSYIQYRLPRTMVTGEFSLIITNVATNTEGDKTKVFAMSEGLSDIVTNDRRFTVEKRGDPEGIVAWRFISRDDQIDTEGAEREFVDFDPSQRLPVDGDVERVLQRPHPARRRHRTDGLQQGQGLRWRLRPGSALRLPRIAGRPQRTGGRHRAGDDRASGVDFVQTASGRALADCPRDTGGGGLASAALHPS